LAANLTARRLTAILALATLVALAGLLLARPAPTLANGSRTACSTTHSRHAKPGAVACARSARGKKVHARPRAKARHAKHAVARKRARGKASAPLGTTTATVQVPPRCEDGTDSVAVGAGSYSCDDGSAPTCPGSDPTFSSDGSGFVCGAPATTEMAAPGEPACEDGSAPVQAADGAFACTDGSSATCEDGSPASLSEDGSMLLCTIGSTDATGATNAGEHGCEDGSAPMVEADGSPSCVDGAEPTCPVGSSLVSASDGSALDCEPS